MQQVEQLKTWFKSLKDRVQPKQEWNEEDKRIIDNLISQLGNLYTRKLIKEGTKYKYVNWLKSLRPQNRCPSDEQIQILKEVYADVLSAKGFDLGFINDELNRLEKQLKE